MREKIMDKLKREVLFVRDKTFAIVQKNNEKFSKTATIMTLGSEKYIVIPYGKFSGSESIATQLEYEITNFAINVHEDNIFEMIKKILKAEGIIMADKL